MNDKNAANSRAGLPSKTSRHVTRNSSGACGRCVAILIANGVEATHVAAVRGAFQRSGARVELVATSLAPVCTLSGHMLRPERLLQATSSFVYDVTVLPGGDVSALKNQPVVLAFVAQAFRHAKTVGVLGEGLEVFKNCPVPAPGFHATAGLQIEFGVLHDIEPTTAFLDALVGDVGRHRHFSRMSGAGVPVRA